MGLRVELELPLDCNQHYHCCSVLAAIMNFPGEASEETNRLKKQIRQQGEHMVTSNKKNRANVDGVS
jgi:hypothetical protein